MDAATIEQMNKVRASVGLAPLPVPGKDSGPQFKDAESESEDDISTLDKRQAAAGNNWQKLENERLERLDRQKRKDAAKKARDAAQRNAKLSGKGLADDEEEQLDTRTWLLQQKKRQKKIEQARKLEAELAERERAMQADYSSKDLAGVKVGHEVEEFDEMTGEKILTLKDTEIGEESEDDELENADLRAQEKLNEKLQLKKKRPDYDPTEMGEEKAVLSKYDEEIDGKKAKRFTLDGKGTSIEAQQKKISEDGVTKSSKTIKISLDSLFDDTPANDYQDPAKVKVKKPKKKKEKKQRQREVDEIEPENADAMDVDNGRAAGAGTKRALDFDDDALQAKLAEQRRKALQQRRKLDAAEIVRQMGDEMPIDEAEPEDGGLVFDETTEFVENLKKPDDVDEDEPRSKQTSKAAQVEDVEMAQSYAAVQDEDEDRPQPDTTTNATTTGLDAEENLIGHGLGASLALLKKRGLIQGDDDGAADRNRQRNQFLADKEALIAEFDQKAKDDRERERKSGRWEKMSHRERETFAKQQNEAREQYLSRLQAEMFNTSYKPDVKLEYFDEFGRSMNQKEAFKHLSHSFHGKTSGKLKTEKRLKKIADEKKDMAKGVLRVGNEGGMLDVQGREGKRTKQAGVRLQ